MSIFDAYDAEFTSISQEINRNINELRHNTTSDSSGNLIKHIDALFVQSNDLIKQMEVEVRGHDPATKKVLGEKVVSYKKSNNSLKSDFERVKEQAQRSSLVGNKSIEQRQRLLDANDKLARQNELIANAQRTVAETEEVGMEITSELTRNREKIQSSRAKVRNNIFHSNNH
jgi:vesicle transport through interaction with t-SNAREs 1